MAVRQLWTASGGKLIEVARLAAANPSESNLFAFRKMLAANTSSSARRSPPAPRPPAPWNPGRFPAGGPAERLRALENVLTGMGGAQLHREMAARRHARR